MQPNFEPKDESPVDKADNLSDSAMKDSDNSVPVRNNSTKSNDFKSPFEKKADTSDTSSIAKDTTTPVKPVVAATKPTPEAIDPVESTTAFQTLETTPAKKKRSVLAPVLTVLLLLALLGAAAVWYFMDQQSADTKQKLDAATAEVESLKAQNKTLKEKNDSLTLTNNDATTDASLTSSLAVVKKVYDGSVMNSSMTDAEHTTFMTQVDALYKANLSTDLYTKWKQSTSTNIVTCSENYAPSYTYGDGKLADNVATFPVTANYANKPTKISVTIDATTLKITGVQCPAA